MKKKAKDRPAGWSVAWEPWSDATMRRARILVAKENRQEEFDSTCRAIMDEFHCSLLEAFPEAARKCKINLWAPVVDHQAQQKANLAEFEKAIEGLPNTANPRVEWEWISSHPAMMRHERSG